MKELANDQIGKLANLWKEFSGSVVVEKGLKDSFLTCQSYGRSGTRVMTLLMYIKCI